MQLRLILLLAITFIDCPFVFGAIDVPDNFVNTIGETIDFQIPSDSEPDLFGVNYLPLGLVLDPPTGRITGTFMETGQWLTVLYTLKGGTMETKTITWNVLAPEETDASNQSFYVIRAKVGQDLSDLDAGFRVQADIETVSGLPDGLTFNHESLSFSGAPNETGLYEIQFSFKQGPSQFFHTVIMTVSPSHPIDRVTLPTYFSSSIVYFKGRYYFPASKETVSVSEDLKEWEEIIPVSGKFVREFVKLDGVLVGNCHGGYVVSHDGVTFEFKTFPNNQSADRLTAGKNGILAEFQDANRGSLFYSTDGLDWVEWDFPMEVASEPIIVGDKFYFRVNDTFYITRDGAEWWTKQRQNFLGDMDRDSIVYGNGVFVALGHKDDEIFSSETIEYWEIQTIRTGVEWRGVSFSDGKFFLWGVAEESGEPDTILTSFDGRNWSALNIGNEVLRVDEVKQVNGKIIARQQAQNGQPATLDIGTALNVPGFFLPNFMEFPPGKEVYYPLRISGDYTTLKAFGLPRGLHFDPNIGAIYGTAKDEWFSKYDVFFVGDNRGIPGMVEEAELYLQPSDGLIPTIGTPCVTGQVGIRLGDQSLSFFPDDHSSQVAFTGKPDWLTFDGHRFDGVPPESMDTTFTVHVSNMYGATSREFRLVITKPVFQQIETTIDVREFAYAQGRYYVSNHFESFWSTDLENWNATAPAVRGLEDLVHFKGWNYIVDSPRVYRSPDGGGWIWLEDIPEIYNPRPGSLFKSADRLYCIANDELVSSEDGLNWTVLDRGDRPSHYRVTYQGQYFFAYWLSEDVIYRSSDALNWKIVFGADENLLNILDIVYGNGVYLALAEPFEGETPLLRSIDGQNWEKVVVPEGFPIRPTGIGFEGGQFHVGGFGDYYLFSEDGLNWTIYTFPNSSTSPRFEHFSWDGQYVHARASGGRLYRRLSESVPPVVTDVYDQVLILDQEADLAVEIEGEINQVAMYGFPEGVSFDLTNSKLVGVPRESGNFNACLVAYNDKTFSQAAHFNLMVSDLSKVPRFKADFYVIPRGDSDMGEIIDYSDEYHHFELSAENLPSPFELSGYRLSGDNVPAGSYLPTFTLSSPDGTVRQSKQIPVYVSPLFYPFIDNWSLHLKGAMQVPFTESVILSPSIEVASVSGLPEGLRYDANQQLISGSPLETGEFLITVDLVNESNDFYYRMTIAEDLPLVKPVQGTFNPSAETYVYEVNLENPEDYTYQWYYSGYAIRDSEDVSGSGSSMLTLNSLENFDPQEFSVRVSRGGLSTAVKAPFRNTLSDYNRWADDFGLNSSQRDPLFTGNGTGYPNIFLFMQAVTDSDTFIPPEIVKSDFAFQCRFYTTRFWNAEDFTLLVSKNLKQDFLELEPRLVHENDSVRTWLTNVADPLSGTLFVSLKGRFLEN